MNKRVHHPLAVQLNTEKNHFLESVKESERGRKGGKEGGREEGKE